MIDVAFPLVPRGLRYPRKVGTPIIILTALHCNPFELSSSTEDGAKSGSDNDQRLILLGEDLPSLHDVVKGPFRGKM